METLATNIAAYVNEELRKSSDAAPALQFPENPELQSSLHLSSLYIHMYIHIYGRYIRTELDVRQQGAAFGSQVRHSRRLQCHAGWQGGRRAKKECYARGWGKLRRCHSNRLQDCVDITLQVTFEEIPATAAKVNRRT